MVPEQTQKRAPGLSPPKSGRRLVGTPEDRGSQEYALERANEAFGHKPSKAGLMEVFIALGCVAAAVAALSDCS